VYAGKDKWLFRLPQSNNVMGHAVIEHMKKQGIKTVGFLGYADVYGQQWLEAVQPELEKAGIKMVGVERFARTDTSVTPKLEIDIRQPRRHPGRGFWFSAPAMPAMGFIVTRGYKGKVLSKTHTAATPTCHALVAKPLKAPSSVSGPALLSDQLPEQPSFQKAGLGLRSEV